ncbi:hypothetical protein ONZ45_g14333 [Pleurotus djamor]|nr:hypothetical protein ONZ45_g14333 [Pleurotus djamor]
MASIGTWLWGTSQLDDAIDRATSELLPAGAEDIALNLEICDQIRSKSVPAKDAMRALKRRLNHKNPNVQLLTLGLTDVCVKNGGDLFLAEVASREFMDNLVSILKIPALNLDVKNSLLRHIQNWSIAFEGKPSLGYVGQVYKTLLNEGFKFPPKDLAVANSAMVDTQTAPEWIDSDVCLRCRTAFTFTNRKHHCRNCGQVFDQACSSKSMPLPHFGITQEVRVCDGCYNKLTKKAERVDKPHHHHHHKHSSAGRRRSVDLPDFDLQRAIRLSLEETNLAKPGYASSQPPADYYSEPPLVDRSTRPPASTDDDDADLKAAIEASLRDASAPRASAPVVVETPRLEQPSYNYASAPLSTYSPDVAPPHPALPAPPKIPTYDLEPLEEDVILTFSQTVEQVQAQGGRDMSRYPAVTELYDKANGLRPKLAMSLDDAGRKEEMLSDMHEKLSEAVKLYDQLLTQQISHPRWRAPQTASYRPNAASPVASGSGTGYTQWAPQSPQVTAATSQYQQQPAWQAPSSPPTQTSILSQAPVSYQPMAPPAPQTSVLPPVSLPSQPQLSSSPPPPPSNNYRATSTSPTLARHGTVTYAPSAPPPPAQPSLTRSYTLTQAPTQVHTPIQQPQQQPSYPQFYATPAPPQQQQQQSLPQFPVAPTSAPTAFSLYGPSIPTGIAQTEERKEALLIDL